MYVRVGMYVPVNACMCACVRACVPARVCLRAFVRASVCVCVGKMRKMLNGVS